MIARRVAAIAKFQLAGLWLTLSVGITQARFKDSTKQCRRFRSYFSDAGSIPAISKSAIRRASTWRRLVTLGIRQAANTPKPHPVCRRQTTLSVDGEGSKYEKPRCHVVDVAAFLYCPPTFPGVTIDLSHYHPPPP